MRGLVNCLEHVVSLSNIPRHSTGAVLNLHAQHNASDETRLRCKTCVVCTYLVDLLMVVLERLQLLQQVSFVVHGSVSLGCQGEALQYRPLQNKFTWSRCASLLRNWPPILIRISSQSGANTKWKLRITVITFGNLRDMSDNNEVSSMERIYR